MELQPKFVVENNSVFASLVRFSYFLTHKSFGRGFGLVTKSLKFFYKDRICKVKFKDGSLFAFRFDDDYWNRLLIPEYGYERELELFFKDIGEIDFKFIDAGSNIGYWSVLMTSKMLRERQVFAIEASSDTFELLQLNWRLNNSRFNICRNAVYERHGEMMSFSGGPHAGRHLEQTKTDSSETVQTVTLDEIAKQHNFHLADAIVVKLDIEGAETSALRGARGLLQRDCLVVYEDHGKDKKHTVSDFVINELGSFVYFLEEHQGALRTTRIEALSQLDAIKINPLKGYNFCLVNAGSQFLPALEKACH